MGCTGSSKRSGALTKLTTRQIAVLKRQTKFTEEEIRQWHADFLRECPNGRLTVKKLMRLCQQFYPSGDVSGFCKRLFAVMDGNEDGTVDFVEYLIHMNILVRGSIDERLGLAFEIYDASKDGLVDEVELAAMIFAKNDLTGQNRGQNQRESRKIAAEVMTKLDLNHDKKLNKREFINGCKTDTGLRRILAPGVESSVRLVPSLVPDSF